MLSLRRRGQARPRGALLAAPIGSGSSAISSSFRNSAGPRARRKSSSPTVAGLWSTIGPVGNRAMRTTAPRSQRCFASRDSASATWGLSAASLSNTIRTGRPNRDAAQAPGNSRSLRPSFHPSNKPNAGSRLASRPALPLRLSVARHRAGPATRPRRTASKFRSVVRWRFM